MTENNFLKERDEIPDEVFRTLLDLYMISNPWPLGQNQKAVFFGFLTAESHKRDYTDLIEAYHEFEVGKND